MGKLRRLHLAGAIMARPQLANAPLVDVEADHGRAPPCEGGGNRQTDIAKADDGKLSTMRHELSVHPWAGQAF